MKGLYQKYAIQKANGDPVDPNGSYFVLRYDTDPAARAAMWQYVDHLELGPLKSDLTVALAELERTDRGQSR